jgi:uncharacterized membrane protein (DUF485 family)
MLHEPVKSHKEDGSSDFKMVFGARMFVVYAIFYVGFVVINIAAPKLMEAKIIFGLNLAVTYGFGLIILALILAVIYNHFCTAKERELSKQVTEEKN